MTQMGSQLVQDALRRRGSTDDAEARVNGLQSAARQRSEQSRVDVRDRSPDPGRLPPLVIPDNEYEALLDLICRSETATPGIQLLWQELQRADVVPAGAAPDDVVRIDSWVHFSERADGENRVVRIVYPDDAAPPALQPVTGSLGAALIGLRAGDDFCWLGPHGEVRAVRLERVEPPTRPRRRGQAGLLRATAIAS